MDKSWKREERIIAKAFNTTRALMKGTAEKSDIDSDLFCAMLRYANDGTWISGMTNSELTLMHMTGYQF